MLAPASAGSRDVHMRSPIPVRLGVTNLYLLARKQLLNISTDVV
jgi:hypothetical protein